MKATIYNVKIQFWRESFNGHDYIDGQKTYRVKASTERIATERACKLARKDHPVGWLKIESVV